MTSNASQPPRSEHEPGPAGCKGDGSDYVLDEELGAASVSARAGIVEVLKRELIGPAEGEEEILSSSPDQRYLLGRIAVHAEGVVAAAGAVGTGDAAGHPDS